MVGDLILAKHSALKRLSVLLDEVRHGLDGERGRASRSLKILQRRARLKSPRAMGAHVLARYNVRLLIVITIS